MCPPRPGLQMKFGLSTLRWMAASVTIAFAAGCANSGKPTGQGNGRLIYSVKSPYSNIQIHDYGRLRSLSFVETGVNVRQSLVDLDKPGHLILPYARYMFASMLVKQPQQRVLVVGLGGGSMVRFLNQHFPETHVDAVEIDPEIVRIAADYFGTRPSRRTRIFTADAFDYLRRDTGRYDAIYMDAFLEPGPKTDPRGVPQNLKTTDFLRGLRQKLNPGGVIAFNLSEHRQTEQDIRTIASAFPAIYEFRVPKTKNRVVIVTLDPASESVPELRAAGQRLDAEHSVGFSFEAMAEALDQP